MTKDFKRAELLCVFAGILISLLIFSSPSSGLPPSFFELASDSATTAASVSTVFVLAMVVWIGGQDLVSMTIPDGPLVAIAVVGASARMAQSAGELGITAMFAGIDGLMCGGALLAVREVFFRLRGKDGLGFGDVKLAAAGAVLVGTIAFFWALFLASMAGILFALFTTILKPGRRLNRLAFGVFLAPACWWVWIMGM